MQLILLNFYVIYILRGTGDKPPERQTVYQTGGDMTWVTRLPAFTFIYQKSLPQEHPQQFSLTYRLLSCPTALFFHY